MNGLLTYQHPTKPHAVTHCGWGPIATYDGNGNMVDRWNNNAWYAQEWNADNKVTRVYGNGQDIRYYYDADGVLVRKMQGGATTIYAGPHAEWNSVTGWTNYYWFNGRRIAMRNSGGVYWLHGDHLGSASVTTNSTGGTVA
jgi:YD repeat-containing protein